VVILRRKTIIPVGNEGEADAGQAERSFDLLVRTCCASHTRSASCCRRHARVALCNFVCGLAAAAATASACNLNMMYFVNQLVNKLCGRPPQYASTPCKLTFDLLTLKVVSESRVTWATSVPIWVFLGLSVLDLGPMYATDRSQTDSQTSDRRRQSASSLNAPAY